jgi:hypothetical protein
MPIRPKHTIGEGKPSLARQFAGREDLIRVFDAALERSSAPRVLVYYGVGGIGKSSLRRQLTARLAMRQGIVSAVLDFAHPGFRSEETALFALRRALREQCQVPFPLFDIAYAVYWKKIRPQTPLRTGDSGILEDGDNLGEIANLLGAVPLVGLIPKLVIVAARGGKSLQGWWRKRGSDELQDLPGLEPGAIRERLPRFLAADLKEHLAQHQTSAVLLIDTYEALTEGERSEGQLYHLDAWVRELIAQLPEVLWVIFGRERLRWGEQDPAWAEGLDQHLVRGLSPDEADRFLAASGIPDPAIRQAIVENSLGVPYYLNLAVDAWSSVREREQREPVPADFARTPRELFARFLSHLTQPETEALKVLAVPRCWDQQLAELLLNSFRTGYPITAISELCRFPFVSPCELAGFWSMSQLIRRCLWEHQPVDLRRRVRRLVFDYYAAQLRDPAGKEISPQQRSALAEASYHAQALERELGAEHPDAAELQRRLKELQERAGK